VNGRALKKGARSNHLRRYRQIAGVLSRHGLGYLVGIAGLERFVPFHRGLLGHPRRATPYTQPEHIRMAVEELGTTFIKLGQVLSTRVDLLPPEYLEELAKLQDRVPPVPYPAIREVISQELGQPPESIFATFDPQPMATASIGQAHAATLFDGTEVVVKVRKPGVVEQVQEDLGILHNLAAAASRRWKPAEQYDLAGLVDEFSETLQAELDYLQEGRNAERFGQFFKDDPDVHIPRIFWEATTSRVITLERIRGTKISDVEALEAAGINRQALAGRAAEILLKTVFENGFFHADPHPGNVFIEADGRIGLIDFGMVGTVDELTQGQLVEVLLSITGGDVERLVDAFFDMGVTRGGVDRSLLVKDVKHLMSHYYGRPLAELHLGPLLTDAMSVMQRHHMRLPSNLFLLIKTLIMSEGIGERLDPAFNLATVLEPYAKRVMVRQYSPWRWGQQLGRAVPDMAWLGVELPKRARRIVRALERGDISVRVQPAGLDPYMGRLERLVNRIVLGIIAAALLNGLAVLMSVYHPGGNERWLAVMFAAGMVAATVLGGYLAWSIWRSK